MASVDLSLPDGDDDEEEVPSEEVAVKIDKEAAEKFKGQGNELFKACKFVGAINAYTKAVENDPNCAIYFSNRAFCHIKMENFGLAIIDAKTAIKTDKRYVKGYYRLGAAYLGLGKYKDGLKAFQQVLKLYPSDKDAKKKARACEGQLRAAAFLKAIASEATKPPSETVNWKDVHVEDSYEGPRYTDEMPTITVDFIKDLIAHFKNQRNLHRRYVLRIVIEMVHLLSKVPTMVELDVPEGEHITVCGDVHGQFYDVCNIFELNGLPSATNPYLFNGDFVDRGSFSMEVIMLFFSLKLCFPKHFHMTRGNHESITMNQIYGFKGEVEAKVNTVCFDLFTEAFNYLPLCYLLGGKVFVVHGGLFSEDGVTLDDIRKVDRVRQPPDKGLMCEMMWSDPQPMNGRAPSKRGVGLSFGPDVTKNFLKQNGLELIVRSHEVKMDGYEVEADGHLITVFSAPNYCDSMGNMGAFIRFEHDMKPDMTSFGAVPHPTIQPMKYAQPMFQM